MEKKIVIEVLVDKVKDLMGYFKCQTKLNIV
jgi:hypothetical protein